MPTTSLTALLAQVTTTTVEGQRMVGDPLPPWVLILAGAALLAVILGAGAVLRRRTTGQRPERGTLDPHR